MPWYVNLLVVVEVVCAGAICILVLLQHGKGADMGAAFGSGASGSLFGASGSANFLSRTTAIVAGVFFLNTIGLAYSSNSLRAAHGGGLMSTVAPAAPAAPAADPAAGTPAQGGAAAPAPASAAPSAASGPAPSAAPSAAPTAANPPAAADKSAGIPK